MKTVAEHIRGKFSLYGIRLTDDTIEDICADAGLNPEDEYVASAHKAKADYGIALFIPEMLLHPQSKSVSENGHSKSQSWDISGIKEYYAFLCRKYGLDDHLNADKPKVRFL